MSDFTISDHFILKCRYCEQTFTTTINLHNHISVKHPTQINTPLEVSNSPISGKGKGKEDLSLFDAAQPMIDFGPQVDSPIAWSATQVETSSSAAQSSMPVQPELPTLQQFLANSKLDKYYEKFVEAGFPENVDFTGFDDDGLNKICDIMEMNVYEKLLFHQNIRRLKESLAPIIRADERTKVMILASVENFAQFSYRDLARNNINYTTELPNDAPQFVVEFLNDLDRPRPFLTTRSVETVDSLKSALGQTEFDKLFVKLEQNSSEETTHAIEMELQSYVRLIRRGQNRPLSWDEWGALEIEVHVTGTIVDPVFDCVERYIGGDNGPLKLHYRREHAWNPGAFGCKSGDEICSYAFGNDFCLVLKDQANDIELPLLIGESESQGAQDEIKLGLGGLFGLKIWQKFYEADGEVPVVILSLHMLKNAVRMYVSWMNGAKYNYHLILNAKFSDDPHLAFNIARMLYNFKAYIVPRYSDVFKEDAARQRAFSAIKESKGNLFGKPSYTKRRITSRQSTPQSKRSRTSASSPMLDAGHAAFLCRIGYDIEARRRGCLLSGFEHNISAPDCIGMRMNLSIGHRRKDNLPVVVKGMQSKSSELKILRMLNQDRYRHCRNHTIPILDVFDTGDCYLVVMPLYLSLDTLGKKDRVLYAIIRDQILEGVAFLHEHRIVHRDLKPDNIVLASTNRIFIIDFGLAIYNPPAAITSSSGTEGYRAPEVNGRKAYDPFKADMWSVGAMLRFLAKRLAVGRVDYDLIKRLQDNNPEERPFASSLIPANEHQASRYNGQNSSHDNTGGATRQQQLELDHQHQCIGKICVR